MKTLAKKLAKKWLTKKFGQRCDDYCSGDGKPYLDFYLKMGGSTMPYRKSLIVLASKDKAILGCY